MISAVKVGSGRFTYQVEVGWRPEKETKQEEAVEAET